MSNKIKARYKIESKIDPKYIEDALDKSLLEAFEQFVANASLRPEKFTAIVGYPPHLNPAKTGNASIATIEVDNFLHLTALVDKGVTLWYFAHERKSYEFTKSGVKELPGELSIDNLGNVTVSQIH